MADPPSLEPSERRLPLSIPPLEIEVAVPQAVLDALLARVAAGWTRLGETRPHWSVQACDAFLPDAIGAHGAAFAASGAADAAHLVAALQRHGLAPHAFPHVCDFGCGVGRVTLPLASMFAHVTACDVSTSHLHVARRAAAEAGARNVMFSLVNAMDFGMASPFDLWFSTLVLQHNPPPITALILQRMFALLRPGGVAAFQVPTYRAGYSFSAAEYLAAPPVEDGFEIHVIPQSRVFALAHKAGCVPLEVREDEAVWPPSIVISNSFVFTKTPF